MVKTHEEHMGKIDLRQLQSLPLEAKIIRSKRKIVEWDDYFGGDTYVSISGGKDSSAMLHLVRSVYPGKKAVFVDTGLEYPENKNIIHNTENVTTIRPTKTFVQVIKEYGYPIISKEVSMYVRQIRSCPVGSKTHTLRTTGITSDGRRSTMGKLPKKWQFLVDAPFKISERCCDILKKNPIKKYNRETKSYPFVGSMANDSRLRKVRYLTSGCNSFTSTMPQSHPMAFWTQCDIWDYIKTYNIPYSKIYDKGCEHTGCIFCCFGIHMEKNNRFSILHREHPKIYTYCMEHLGICDVLKYLESHK